MNSLSSLFDLAQVAAGVTAATSFVSGLYFNQTRKPLPSGARYGVSAVMSLLGAGYYAYSSGQINNLDWHNPGQMMGAFGITLALASQFYDKGVQPVKAALRPTPRADGSAADAAIASVGDTAIEAAPDEIVMDAADVIGAVPDAAPSNGLDIEDIIRRAARAGADEAATLAVQSALSRVTVSINKDTI